MNYITSKSTSNMVSIHRNLNNKEKIYLLLWGIACAYVFVRPYLFSLGEGWVPEWRGQRLIDRYEELLKYGIFDFSRVTHTLGYPLYFPYLMRIINIRDGLQMYYFVQAIAGAVIVAIYPYLLYEIMQSWKVSLISPIILHVSIGDMLYINKAGEYFSSLWVLAMGIPLLFLLNRIQKQSARLYWIVGGIAIVIMLSNVMRSHSGLPLLLVCLIVLTVKKVNKILNMKCFLLTLLIFLTSYNLLGRTIPNIIAKKWGVNGTEAYNSSPWHSILAGMLYIETEEGLFYSDDFAKDLVAELYPEIEYNSNEYYDKCKELTLSIVRNRPLFLINGILVKYKESVKLQIKYLMSSIYLSSELVISLILLIMLIWKKRVKMYLHEYGIILFEIVILAELSLYTGVLTVPNAYYQWGGLGAMGILVMFMLLSLFEKNMNYIGVQFMQQ